VHRIPPLLAGSILVGAIALATAWTWLHLTGARTLSPGAVIACTAVSVAVALALEHAARRVRRGRPRRAHARPTTTRKDNASV
jgi:predicted Co/Zn/Cd cation transporter (cation efflux family)